MDSATVAVINYLEQRAEVDRVHVKEKSACSADAIRRWEEKNSCQLPDDLKQFYAMSDGLEIRWSVKMGSKNTMPTFLGKLYINSLNDLMKYSMSGSKEMAIDELNDFAEDESPRFYSPSWQIFELDPCDGYGRVCLVYNAYGDPNIWFLDRSLHFHRLASNFTGYYRLLLLHCGLPYWQYKYTDFGIPPYVLHWFYTIVPSLVSTHADEDRASSTMIPFNAEKVFQRNPSASARASKDAADQAHSITAVRSATQNQKRSMQRTKCTNRSSSVPRSINN